MQSFLNLLTCSLVLSGARWQTPDTTVKSPDFARDIKPLLARSCIKCHGANNASGGFRLDSMSASIRGGTSGFRGIVPHNAAASRLIQRVAANEESLRMPPVSSGLPRLSPSEVTLLKNWINAGPSWEKSASGKGDAEPVHWSLRTLRSPKVATATGNPIDSFIISKLRSKGLTLSKRANKVDLLRRLYYDLIGLPPTPEDVAQFVSDTRPGAYERVVDKLLASPRYGERWARHWLDTIHFADSHGFEHDIGRENAWPFRDYVINAFNNDISWTNFIKQQLAADVFWPNDPSLTPALGYLGAGTFDLSAYTTAPKNFENGDRDDMVNQTMSAFVSTTANCARCHNHKFDPIPQEDYYALQAVFAGIVKGDIEYDESSKIRDERKRLTSLISDIDKKTVSILDNPDNKQVIEKWISTHNSNRSWNALTINSATSKSGATMVVNSDGTIASGGIRPETDTYTTSLSTSLPTISAIRLDVLSSPTLPKGGPGRQDNGNLHLSEIEIEVVEPNGLSRKLKIAIATADFNQAGWGIERAIDGDMTTAWGIYPEVGKSHNAVFVLSAPATMNPGAKIVVRLHQNHGGGHLIGLYRLSATDGDPNAILPVPAEITTILSTPVDKRTEDQRRSLGFYALKEHASQLLSTLPPKKTVFAAASSANVLTEGIRSISEPRTISLLERGEIDKPKYVVNPGSLSAIKNLSARFELKTPKLEAERRADLAEWIADKNNPLTWRSAVNRVWHYHFGRGICDTPSDFGKMGGVPSHPELLDFLAVWFRDEAGGSLRKLHRMIVTSHTYCQSSDFSPLGSKLDGENRLLWRQNRQRLDADAYRDFTLSASGKLDLRMGGPGIKHFTSSPGPQLTPALNYYAYDWNSEGSGRRSIYSYVWRGIADPFMEALDFPDLGLLAPVRSFSVSALQALALYNNNFIIAASEAMAKRYASDPTLDDQISAVVQSLWLRSPNPNEKRQMLTLAREHGLAALCRVLLNSNEYLFVK